MPCAHEEYVFLGHRLLYLKQRENGRQIWQDVPEHFGRFYPSTLSLPSGEVDGWEEGAWFAQQLREILSNDTVTYRITIEPPGPLADSAYFANCLDPVFGHALYKLAAARALSEGEDGADVVVIVSRATAPYAHFADRRIVVEEPLGRLLHPDSNLMHAVREVSRLYSWKQWAFCNTSRLGAQAAAPMLPGPHERNGEPRRYVTYVHRDDRPWGGLINIQTARVNRVFGLLKQRHVGLRTAVVGASDHSQHYHADSDLVAAAYTGGFDAALEALCRRSLCVFGVHGSNMLLPSHFAASTVELQPSTRLGNAVQAYWPDPTRSTIETLFTYRVLYGDRFLLSPGPRTVARMIGSLVSGIPGMEARFDSQVYVGGWEEEEALPEPGESERMVSHG